jgi:hypothetical protein
MPVVKFFLFEIRGRRSLGEQQNQGDKGQRAHDRSSQV